MAGHRTAIAIGCAIAAAVSLIAAASAQTAAVKPAATAVRLNISDANLRILRAAKARPTAVKLRAALSARSFAAHIDLKAVDKSAVPVLVSPRSELLANLRVFTKPDHYAASTVQSGTVIQINGTRAPVTAPKNFRLPKTTPTIKLANPATAEDVLQNVRVDHTASGIDVTFTRFGSVYNVSMDCADVSASDPEAIGPKKGAKPSQCSEDNALAIVKEMEVIGGGEPSQ